MTSLIDVPTPTADAIDGQSRWTRVHYALIGAIALVQMLIRAEMPLGQDMLWGARFGSDFLSTGHLAHADSYSWTAAGKTWIPNSWGWNVVLGVAYRGGGVIGLWLLGAILAVGMAMAVARLAERLGAAPLPTAAWYAPVGLLGLAAVPRAQTLSTIVILAIPELVLVALAAPARSAGRAIVGLLTLQLVWMNLHSAALIGPVLVLVCGVGVLVGRGSPQGATRVAGMTFGTILACLVTPYGAAPLTHAGDVRSTSVGLVTEWDTVGFGSIAQALGLLAVLGAAALCVVAWRAGRFATSAAIALLALATASAIRFLPMMAILAAAEVALLFGRAKVRPRMFAVMVAATSAVLSLIAIANLRDLRSLGPTVSPALVAEIPAECRLLNDDLAGDAVTLLRPQVPVSLDGRYDMYGRAVITKVEGLFADHVGADATLRRDRVNCILGPTSMPLVQRLSADPNWAVRDKDSVRTLLVRASGDR